MVLSALEADFVRAIASKNKKRPAFLSIPEGKQYASRQESYRPRRYWPYMPELSTTKL